MLGLTDALWSDSLHQAVVPILVGPAAALGPILLGALLAVLKMLRPAGLKKIAIGLWEQKRFTIPLALLIAAYFYCSARNWFRKDPPPTPPKLGAEWTAFRGGPARAGYVVGDAEPTTDESVWNQAPKTETGVVIKTFYSSPAVVGDRVYVAGTEKGPFVDAGGIFCLDAETGSVIWRFCPREVNRKPFNFLATFSSPSVAYKHDKKGQPARDKKDNLIGYVVSGEALHLCDDARVICLDLNGQLLWQYRTKNHVEASPCISDGRVYIGAGDDGYYCFDLEPKEWEDEKDRRPKPVWHLGSLDEALAGKTRYQDCESSPIVHNGVFYAGLGVDGKALIALDAATGKELWRMNAPYPVFSSPALGYRMRWDETAKKSVREDLLFVGMGNANILQDAPEVRKVLKDPPPEIARTLTPWKKARNERQLADFRTGGEVWCVNLSTVKAGEPVKPEWKLDRGLSSVLGVAFRSPDEEQATAENPLVEGRIYFGSWDNKVRSVSTAGVVLATYQAGAPMPNIPAVGREYVYFATNGGMLQCLDAHELKPLWQTYMGGMVVSSPAVARGHVYIGTTVDGVRCVGQARPVPPVWTRGETGGPADRSPLASSVALSKRFSMDEELALTITSTVMPLSETKMVTEVVKPKAGSPTSKPEEKLVEKTLRFAYVAASHKADAPATGVVHELLKFRHGEINKESGIVWRRPLDKPIVVPPAGKGSDIYFVSGGGSAGAGVLHAIDIDNATKWQYPLAEGGSGQFTLDGDSLLVWSGPSTLTRLKRDSGSRIWSADVPGGASAGTVASSDGLVIASTAKSLTLLDGNCGEVLWSIPAAEPGSPIRLDARSLLVASADGVARLSITGETAWRAPIGKVARPLVIDGEKIVAITTDGAMHVLSQEDGTAWRLKDEVSAGRLTTRRVAPTTQVDVTVTPVLVGDRIVYGGQKKTDEGMETDLMLLALPEKYQESSATTQPDGGAAPAAESVAPPVTCWCDSAYMGPILQPVVLVEGQAYTATKNVGLVLLAKPKK